MEYMYGEEEINYLKAKDAKLGAAIDAIGIIHRPVMPDLFTAIVYNIIGQQISTAALETVWARFLEKVQQDVTAASVLRLSKEELQSIGITYRKVDYIQKLAAKVLNGSYVLADLYEMSDEEAIVSLSSLDGIGRWTAEMILIFSMQRPDVVSYGDLAILRGMRMLYHHREIDKKKFQRYKRRYAPYGTTASLYLWAIAGGAIEGMKDYGKKNYEKKVKPGDRRRKVESGSGK